MIDKSRLLGDDYQQFLREVLQRDEVAKQFRSFLAAREALLQLIGVAAKTKGVKLGTVAVEASEFASQSVAACKAAGKELTEKQVGDWLASEYGLCTQGLA